MTIDTNLPIVVRIPAKDTRHIAERLALACKATGGLTPSAIIRDALDTFLPPLSDLQHAGGSGDED